MRYISTNSPGTSVSLSEATCRCVASDGGLFMPEYVPVVPKAFFNNFEEMNIRDIAYVVATTFFGDDINPELLKGIVDYAFVADAPLVELSPDNYVLELFHGPTLTFKDYGARFMSGFLDVAAAVDGRRRCVITASTGNTAAAVANAAVGMKDVDIFILFPHGKLSRMAEAQFTTLGRNIHPIEVNAGIDECKSLVGEAIAASDSIEDYCLIGANSINIARLLPQIVFYYYACSRLRKKGHRHVASTRFAIPCGNMGNLVAAELARRTGLQTGRIIAACAADNSAVAGEWQGGGHPAVSLAPSMSMRDSSNYARLLHLYGGNREDMVRDMEFSGVDDADIIRTINYVRDRYGYTFDAHGAAAYAARLQALGGDVSAGVPVVTLATGHPAKLLDTMTAITGASVEMPEKLACFINARRVPVHKIPPTMPALRKAISKALHSNDNR